MSSRSLEEIYGMYDTAAEEYRRAVQQTKYFPAPTSFRLKPSNVFGAGIARYNAREWLKRMKWLDLKLKELGVE